MTNVGFEFEFTSKFLEGDLRDKLAEYGILVKRSRGYKDWVIDYDGSVEPRHRRSYHNTYELVSPPMPMDQAIKTLGVVFKFMQENPVETNTTTGLHVNMDIGRETKFIDPLKLITLVDDEAVARRYKRSKLYYCLPHNSTIRKQARYYNNLKNKPCGLVDYVKQWALTNRQLAEKYSAINFGKQKKQGFIEFRMIGNRDYQNRYKEIVKDIRHFETCMIKAADANIGNKAVVRRLNKMAA